MEKDVKINNVVNEEKEYYTKQEVEQIIAKNIQNALGDIIMKLNEQPKQPQEPQKPKTIKDLRF